MRLSPRSRRCTSSCVATTSPRRGFSPTRMPTATARLDVDEIRRDTIDARAPRGDAPRATTTPRGGALGGRQGHGAVDAQGFHARVTSRARGGGEGRTHRSRGGEDRERRCGGATTHRVEGARRSVGGKSPRMSTGAGKGARLVPEREDGDGEDGNEDVDGPKTKARTATSSGNEDVEDEDDETRRRRDEVPRRRILARGERRSVRRRRRTRPSRRRLFRSRLRLGTASSSRSARRRAPRDEETRRARVRPAGVLARGEPTPRVAGRAGRGRGRSERTRVSRLGGFVRPGGDSRTPRRRRRSSRTRAPISTRSAALPSSPVPA